MTFEIASFREDHDSGRLSDREFQRRLAFCSRKLKEAKLCLRGGFTPVEEYIGGGGGNNNKKEINNEANKKASAESEVEMRKKIL